jgi:hypothetical protein
VRGKRLRGLVDLDLADHVVLLGYTPGRTARIVAELTAEDRAHVVLCCGRRRPRGPAARAGGRGFVRGDLSSADVMTRADVARARTAVVDVGDDNEALAVALAVTHANPAIHLVVALRDLGRLDTLRYVRPDVQAVQWHMPFLLTEEATDPGIAQVYSDLMTSGGHGNTYSTRLPGGFPHRTFGECQTWFGRTFGATVLALRTGGGRWSSAPLGHPGARGHDALLRRRAAHRRRRLRARALSSAPQQAAQVGRLPEVLQVVGEHAEQPDAEGDRRVPVRVDDPVEVVVGEARRGTAPSARDRARVAEQQVGRGDPDGVDLLVAHPVAGGRVVDRAGRSGRPSPPPSTPARCRRPRRRGRPAPAAGARPASRSGWRPARRGGRGQSGPRPSTVPANVSAICS